MTSIWSTLSAADAVRCRLSFCILLLILLSLSVGLAFSGGYHTVKRWLSRPTCETTWFDVLVCRVLPSTAYALALEELDKKPLALVPIVAGPTLVLVRAAVLSIRRSKSAKRLVHSVTLALAFLIFEVSITVNALRHLPVFYWFADYIYIAQIIFTVSKCLNTLRKCHWVKSVFYYPEEGTTTRISARKAHRTLDQRIDREGPAADFNEKALNILSGKVMDTIQPEIERLRVDLRQYIDEAVAELHQQFPPVQLEPPVQDADGPYISINDLAVAIEGLQEALGNSISSSSTRRRVRTNRPIAIG